jgi:sugar lactone lactonase YvrE
VAGVHIAFRIAQKGLIPEGLAFDTKSGRYFVSSARLGKIVQVDRHGRASDFVAGGIAGVHSLSGIGIDGRRRILWACSTASPRFASYKQGDANDPAVVAFDLNSGKLIRRIAFEDPKGFCDDLSVGNDGSVYVSDSTGSLLALAPNGEQLTTLVPHGVIRSPQGSALAADGRILYVADYGGPVRAVDLRTGDVAPLRLPDDFQSMTIDGITRDGNRLIAVQNGIEPNRIVALTLSRAGLAATSWQILEMNHPLVDEPTIGKVVGRTYYFSGASQGNKFDAGNPDPAKLTDALVFAIPLGTSAASARHIERVQAYRDAHARGDLAAERAFVAPEARVWYEEKRGNGEPLAIGAGGRYAHWDEFFRSRSELTGWTVDGRAVTATVHETNDFYRLLDWEPVPYRMTWWLDRNDRITGVLIQSTSEKAKNRMAKFREWAGTRNPGELAYLMPGGRLDPTADRAERWKAILTEWRAAAGLPSIE